MISLSYSCRCGFASSILDDAQDHSNSTQHHVSIVGFMTPTKSPVANIHAVEERHKARVREATIMRLARDKGLLKKK